MNISHDGATVRFKTESEEVFLAEKSGAKSNIVRIIDNDEYEMLNTHTPKKIIIQYQEEIFLRTLTNLHFAKLFGKVIVIFSWAHERSTDHPHSIKVSTDHELTHTVTFNENKPDPKDKLSPVLLPRSVILDLNRHRRGRSHAEFISDLLGAHITSQEQTTPSIELAKTRRCPDCGGDLMNTRPGEFAKCSICRTLFCLDPGVETAPAKEEVMSSEETSIDERFAAITISNGTLALLQSIAHGRTMNMVIKELYEENMCTRAKERGPLHD
jgi:hypothetical protein